EHLPKLISHAFYFGVQKAMEFKEKEKIIEKAKEEIRRKRDLEKMYT
ncbi:hypothetical protein LCGC14_1689810, partial [marine sediment metagenome]